MNLELYHIQLGNVCLIWRKQPYGLYTRDQYPLIIFFPSHPDQIRIRCVPTFGLRPKLHTQEHPNLQKTATPNFPSSRDQLTYILTALGLYAKSDSPLPPPARPNANATSKSVQFMLKSCSGNFQPTFRVFDNQ
jgi:hypothetical protein